MPALSSTRPPLRLAVLASGSGISFQAILGAIRRGELQAEVAVLVTNEPGAGALEWAAKAGIPALTVDHRDHGGRDAFTAALMGELARFEVDLVVLAGFLRILGGSLIDAYAGRIVNIHPSLLPAFPGLDAPRQALGHGCKVTGATVHFVERDVDAGPIIAQVPVPIYPTDTIDALEHRLHDIEVQLYPLVLQLIAERRVRITGPLVEIAGPAPVPR